jgi:hypothetical protein
MRIQLDKITEYQDKQCDLFSKYSYFSSLSEYKKRNQDNKEKIINDIYNGKKAEFLVYNFLVSEQKKISSPDLNIYEKYSKSYDADLHIKDISIHVKSHSVNGSYPISWVFQKQDPLLSVIQEHNFLALVVMNEETNYMYLKKVSEVTFREPLREYLKETKVCIYESDFI